MSIKTYALVLGTFAALATCSIMGMQESRSYKSKFLPASEQLGMPEMNIIQSGANLTTGTEMQALSGYAKTRSLTLDTFSKTPVEDSDTETTASLTSLSSNQPNGNDKDEEEIFLFELE